MLVCEKSVEKNAMTLSQTLNGVEEKLSKCDWRDHLENCFMLGYKLSGVSYLPSTELHSGRILSTSL